MKKFVGVGRQSFVNHFNDLGIPGEIASPVRDTALQILASFVELTNNDVVIVW